MSAKMTRRRRHDRRKRILTQRREDALFFARGTFPASATSFTMCSCGARAFARGRDDSFLDDFDAAHAYCDEEQS
ncbi:hypothetical protein [Microbacterium allomyrinae]|uniref:Uncharacterized protein n=1 Tax=Microbacterium allomyrinae TaxID=2830666 RepID=A0A9X1LTY6_9MICO|nr:hypothetical protein [Microbacterium allomyrinae]MCC2031801.1 hypothetical protein [Microbacterium allomyrinae]